MDLNSKLLQMIQKVSEAPDERNAIVALLQPLLLLFEMDQAVFCEWHNEEPQPIFAMDCTKKILPIDHQFWISKTLMREALHTMQPCIHVDKINKEQGIPKSINEFSLKNVVCLPVCKNPSRVIYLASRKNPLRQYSQEELTNFKIAADASLLAMQQHQNIRDLKNSKEELEQKLKSKPKSYIYGCQRMEKLHTEAKQIAPFNISVFIQGESGVGKEEIAKSIHALSERKGKFIAINCANLTESLLESELFGYVKGAFTGALSNKKGLIQEAEGGTFFFDEIAEMPMNLQAKLLRVIEERKIRAIGASIDHNINVRFLSASHKNLAECIEKGSFREDLFYRIQEANIQVPALRERDEDISLLAQHFVSLFAQEFNLSKRQLSNTALEKMSVYNWPGNIRELKNICRMATIMSQSEIIEAEDIRISGSSFQSTPSTNETILQNFNTTTSNRPAETNSPVDAEGSLKDRAKQYEKQIILDLLKKKGATQLSVAKELEISVRTLQRILGRSADVVDSRETFSENSVPQSFL